MTKLSKSFSVPAAFALTSIAALMPTFALSQSAYQTIETSGTTPPTISLLGDGLTTDRVAGCNPLPEGGDWIDDQDRTFRRVIPRNCYFSYDNPPLFWWAPHLNKSASAQYTLTLQKQNSTDPAVTYTTPYPYINIPQTLDSGTYTWQISVPTSSGVATSRMRTFSIDSTTASDSKSLSVLTPNGSQAFLKILSQKRRPRLFPPTADKAAIFAAAQSSAGARYAEYQLFLNSAKQFAGELTDSNGDYRPYTLRTDAGNELAAITTLGIAWKMTGYASYLTVGKQRLLALADATPGSQWDPNGPTSERNQDQYNRAIYLALARGFDLFYNDLSYTEKQTVLSTALVRLHQYVDANVTNASFAAGFPYKSHEANSLSFAVQALALLADGSPSTDAAQMFRSTWDLYRSLIIVWGAQDGATGNSTGYGWSDFAIVPYAFLTLRNVLGTDYLSNRSYFRNAGAALIYQTPPVPLLNYVSQPPYVGLTQPKYTGPLMVFGDGASDVLASYPYPFDGDRAFRVYSTLVDNPLYRWYRQQARDTYSYLTSADYNPIGRAM